jgi:2,3-bisphosphoglycerate-independent phosphoglycerate mutase
MAKIGVGHIKSVSGRYYAMDRDKRWERTKRAYDAIVEAGGPIAPSATEAIKRSYADAVTDEFIVPTIIGDPVPMLPGDAVVFFNFRSDRGRQLTEALSVPEFNGFERSRPLFESVRVTTMTRYEQGLPVGVAFEPHDVEQPLARVISDAGLLQFHCAETEKYAHVTFFFNGGRETPFPGEERVLIPSPKVATYDLQPSMSAPGVTEAVLEAIQSRRFDFIIVNFANCDMVGHTGVLSAAITAVETVDECLGRIFGAALGAGGVLLITADHGNAEEMIDIATGMPMTAHTTNPVPVVLVTPEDYVFRNSAIRPNGILSAVAPTILKLIGIDPPDTMTTPSLF